MAPLTCLHPSASWLCAFSTFRSSERPSVPSVFGGILGLDDQTKNIGDDQDITDFFLVVDALRRMEDLAWAKDALQQQDDVELLERPQLDAFEGNLREALRPVKAKQFRALIAILPPVGVQGALKPTLIASCSPSSPRPLARAVRAHDGRVRVRESSAAIPVKPATCSKPATRSSPNPPLIPAAVATHIFRIQADAKFSACRTTGSAS